MRPAGLRVAVARCRRGRAGGGSCLSRAAAEELQEAANESDQSLCQYAGKAILIVDTASSCGYTSRYEGREALYAEYAAQGLVVLGFPTNDFEQEPGDDRQIADEPVASLASVVSPPDRRFVSELERLPAS